MACEEESKAATEALGRDENDGAMAAESARRTGVVDGRRASSAQGRVVGQNYKKRAAAATASRSRPRKAQTTLQGWVRRGQGEPRSAKVCQNNKRGYRQIRLGVWTYTGAGGLGNEGQEADPGVSGPETGGTDGREDDPG